MHGTHPLWYLLGTVVAVALVGGGYLTVRDQFVADDATGTTSAVMADDPVAADAGVDPAADTAGDGGTGDTVESSDVDESDRPSRPLLDVLPEDERRILQPVVDSPGLTQIELRDRADFSKSKVSQTVSDLEQRGLLYREPQGRTYRVYPSDELDES